MRQSRAGARTGGPVLASLLLAWLVAAAWPSAAQPPSRFLRLSPGPIERPLSIAVADFDRDGLDDLVVANFQAGTIEILTNAGDDTFAPIPSGPFGVGVGTFSSNTAGPYDMVVVELNPEDVDGDAVANAADNCPNAYNPVDVNTGVQLDTDDDGVGDACQILKDTDCDGAADDPIDSDGDGVPDFHPMTLALDNCPRTINAGQEDANMDGVGDACPESPDLIVVTTTQGGTSPFGAIRVRLNDGVGGLVDRPAYGTGIAPGKIVADDFSGDGRPDLALAVTSVDLMQFLPGLADGMFGGSIILRAGDGAQGAVSGDFNNDAHPDLAVANRAADSISVFINSGTALPGTATSTLTLPPPSARPVTLLSGRLDGDPFADLVVLSQGGDKRLCEGTFQDGLACSLDADCDDPQTPQVDGTCEGLEGSISVFLGSLTGALTPGVVIPLGLDHRPRAGLLADLDGDLHLDLAVADFTGGEVLIYPGLGDGTFGPTSDSLLDTQEPVSIVSFRRAGLPAGGPDLAVLDHAHNRIDLYRKDAGSLTYTFVGLTPPPASPWRGTKAMLLTGADGLVAADIVLAQESASRIDVLSGIGNGAFRALVPQPLTGPASACAPPHPTGILEVDLRQDGRPDFAIFDDSAGTVTVITSSPFGVLQEQDTISVGANAKQVSTGRLVTSIDDYDRDCIPNVVDNCPTVFNPCPQADALCAGMNATCPPPSPTTPLCDMIPAELDPISRQCDSDGNGIGDECEVLGATGSAQDSDFDSKPDFDPNALINAAGGPDFDRDSVANTTDNCPTVANNTQTDDNMNDVGDACETLSGGSTVDPDMDGVPTFDPSQLMEPDPVGQALDNCPDVYNPGQEDNNGDHVGNACIVAAALDNCTYTFNSAQNDANGDGVGDNCAVPPQDLVAADPTAGSVTLLAGDGSGHLRPAAGSPLSLTAASAAAVAQFALACVDDPDPLTVTCTTRLANDVAVASRGAELNYADDTITVFKGDGAGQFTAYGTPVPAQGDPDQLLVAPAQPVCARPEDPAERDLQFDPDGLSDLLAAVEPGTSTLEIFLASSQDAFQMGASPLVQPPAQAFPLPVPAPLVTALFSDLNQDGFRDLVALSGPVAGISQVTIYMALGNGLFFTDSSFSPIEVDGSPTLMTADNVNLQTDSILPDLALFSERDGAPIVLTNVLGERADIDASGRVDGFDLAVFAASFGASRGEDFILETNGTLQQTGPGCGTDYRCLVVGTGHARVGQDLPTASLACDRALDPQTGDYSLSVDINLDGVIDGEDLALLASLFGKRPR
jgi:hypothetical protein